VAWRKLKSLKNVNGERRLKIKPKISAKLAMKISKAGIIMDIIFGHQ